MFANCTFCRRNFVIEFQVKLDCYSAKRGGNTQGVRGRGEMETDSKWRQLVGLELQLWHRLALEFNYVARLFFYLAFLFFGTQNRDKIIAKFLELPQRGEGGVGGGG